MRAFLLFCLLACLTGCASGLVFKPAPSAPNPPGSRAAVLRGEMQPGGLYFTAVSRYDGTFVRAAVLSDMGIKLLDTGVWADRTEVYFKLPRLPDAFARAFGNFMRDSFMTFDPPEEALFRDRRTGITFRVSAVREAL